MDSTLTTHCMQMTRTEPRTGLIQHKVRPEVKQWIKKEAEAQERSQAWFVNKLIEDAYGRHQQAAKEAAQ